MKIRFKQFLATLLITGLLMGGGLPTEAEAKVKRGKAQHAKVQGKKAGKHAKAGKKAGRKADKKFAKKKDRKQQRKVASVKKQKKHAKRRG